MALIINDIHIPYYHFVDIWLNSGEQLFCKSLLFGIKISISTVIQHLDTTIITESQVSTFKKNFPGIVGYTPHGVACYHIATIIDLPNQFLITIYQLFKCLNGIK